MIGALAIVGKLFGNLQHGTGARVIDLIGPFTHPRGDALALCLTITDDDDARADLTGAIIELEIKTALEAADPAVVALAVGTGITLRDQGDADTIGQADCVLTSSQLDIAPGVYWLDVVATLAGGTRQHVIDPLELTIAGVVNRP